MLFKILGDERRPCIALSLHSTMSGGAVDANSFLSKQAIPSTVAHTTAIPTILPVPQPQQTTINNTMSSTQTESLSLIHI